MITLDLTRAAAIKGARKQGLNTVRIPCPVHGGRSDSLVLMANPSGIPGWHCHAGCDPLAVRDALLQMRILERDEKRVNGSGFKRTWEDADKRRAKTEQLAHEIWKAAGKLGEASFERLRQRGFSNEEIHAAAKSGVLKEGGGQMVAAVTVCGEKLSGIQRTNLRSNDRRALGTVKGGAIRLYGFKPSEHIVIAEGIETAMAFKSYSWSLDGFEGAHVWSVISANGIADFQVPAGVKRLSVAADFDGAGITGFERLQRRVKDAHMYLPPEHRMDWNDVLKARRGSKS